MRWVAAFTVFAYHVGNFGYFDPKRGGHLLNWAFGSGSAGVSFFFILSGFVLAWSARPGESAGVFWRRRLARVYPVHLVTAAIALMLAYTLVPGLQPSGIIEATANLLLVSSWRSDWWQALNPVSWSLVCEAFFYATFPVLYKSMRRMPTHALTATALTSWIVVLLLPWANDQFALGWTLYSAPLARMPEFVIGVAMGLLVKTGAWRGPGLDVALAITLIGYFLASQVPHPYSYAACTVTGVALLVPAAAHADLTGTPSFWRNPFLVRLGERSFTFYMIHILVMRTGEDLFHSQPHLATLSAFVVAAAVFAVSLALAWALYAGVERPCRRLLLSPWPKARVSTLAPARDRVGNRSHPAKGPSPEPPHRSASTSKQ